MTASRIGIVLRRALSVLAVTAVAASGLTAVSFAVESPQAAVAAPVSGWQAGNILDDASFFNGGAMTEAEIQAFLVAKLPTCDAGYTCLRDYSQSTTSMPATPMCSAYEGAANERAAAIIFKVARTCGISAQVLLVLLQKEQQLVQDSSPGASQYRSATGAGCPDTAGCDANYYGFFNQVHYGAYLLKRYTQPAGTGAGTAYTTRYDLRFPVGQTSAIQYYPDTACGTADVLVANQATHSLYIYTPYTPNPASIAAGFGTGDACSSYGNRNFFAIYNSWFGAGRGSIAGTLVGPGSLSGGLANDRVRAYSSAGAVVASSLTTATGAYTLSGLPADSYRIAFANDGYPDLAAEWWSGRENFGTADPITLSAAQAVTGRNAALKNPSFSDVSPWQPFYTEIEWARSSGVSTGSPDPAGGKPRFSPADFVSRQAMAAFMYRLSGETFAAPAEPTFADVPPSNMFYVAVEWMAAKGISVGTVQPTGKPMFKPDDPVERYVMALFIARYAGADISSPPATQSFADVPPSLTGASAIAWMARAGISTGTPQPSGLPLFKPADFVTRDAMAAFLFRLNALG